MWYCMQTASGWGFVTWLTHPWWLSGQHGHLHATRHGWLIGSDWVVSMGIFMGLDIWLTHRWWLKCQHGHLHLVLPLPLHPPPWITLRCTLPRHGTRHGWLISRDRLSGQHGRLHGARHGWLISGDSVVNVGIFMGLDMADSSVVTQCTWSMLVPSWDLSHGGLITGD